MSEILSGLVYKARECIDDTIDLLLVIAGAGASSAVLEVVKSWFPEQTSSIADETLAAGIGFAMFYWGNRIHRRLAPFGLGIFISAVGAWSSAWISSIILMLKKKA